MSGKRAYLYLYHLQMLVSLFCSLLVLLSCLLEASLAPSFVVVLLTRENHSIFVNAPVSCAICVVFHLKLGPNRLRWLVSLLLAVTRAVAILLVIRLV